MIYAPIAITTLNRYDHLKRCLESLKNNTWASFTDLYISIDFPPHQKYVNGYTKILNYVRNELEGFNKIKIFVQEKNLGAMDNYVFIMNKVFEQYDRAIFLEDDNELSPCFIEFCDKGLNLFEHDNNIIAINASNYVWCGTGYKRRDEEINCSSNNIQKRQLLFHAYATWKKNWIEITQLCKNEEVFLWAKDLKKIIKLHRKSRCFFYSYMERVLFSKSFLPWHNGKLYPIDFVWDIFMLINDKYIIYPMISQTRDWGVDGSGVNYMEEFQNAAEIIGQKINTEAHFNYKITSMLKVDRHEIQLHDKYNYTSKLVRCKRLIKYVCFRLKIKK